MPSSKAKYTPDEKKAFSNLLRRQMTNKGLTGAELTRRINLHLAGGKNLDRSAISWYLSGRSAPGPVILAAIGKVLDMDPQMLLPRDHSQRPGEAAGPPPTRDKDVRMSIVPGGKMHLMINVELPLETGWKILRLLEEHTQPPT